jgi:YHS domain-containing protein
MKSAKLFLTGALLTVVMLAPMSAVAADKKADKEPVKKTAKAKPYPLKTCLVADEKLGEMGEPYVFVYQGQEIKFCCKGCRKDFDKEPAKFMKKLQAAEKKGDKNPTKPADKK